LFAFEPGSGVSTALFRSPFLCTMTGFASIYAALERTPPPFTLRLLEPFVNRKRAVSTGFYGFLLGFPGFSSFSVPL
ncbi:MAG TPA: hypothetical protein VK670_05800, partial [Silvibacterium sp.]|nr:hypothetical protein [Silvibacterium sp.]